MKDIDNKITIFWGVIEQNESNINQKRNSDDIIAVLRRGVPTWNQEPITAAQTISNLKSFVDKFIWLNNYWLAFSMVLAMRVDKGDYETVALEHQQFTKDLRATCNNALMSFYNNSNLVIHELCRKWGISNNLGDSAVHDILNDLVSPRLIIPAMNNERLRRQHGAFLVYPPYAPMREKPTDIKGVETVLIPYAKKAEILKELESIGFSKSHLFPELEFKAEDLKRKFGPKPKSVNEEMFSLDETESAS